MLWEIKDTYAALLLKSVIPVRRPNVYSGGGRCVCKRCSGRSRGLYFSVLPGEAAVQLGKRSGYHLFLSRNINAFGEGDRVDYAKLSFGGACLQLPDRFACVQNETGHWELVWQAGIPMATAAPDDRLIVAAICPDEPYRLIVLENICALRKDGRAEGEWPASGKELHLYCLFCSASGETFSPDCYFRLNR